MSIISIISIAIGILLLAIALPFVFVRYTAVKSRKKSVDLLGGWIKFILWEPNEGVIILRNKTVKYWNEDGKGGTKFIFPILGDELYARVPLTIRMLTWEDDKLLTRESLQIHMKVVIWWKVSNIQKFALDIDESIHLNEKRKEIGSLSSSESWLLALTESTIRVLASRASATQLVTSVTARYLDVHHKDGKEDSENQAIQTISETLAHKLYDDLKEKANTYGIKIDRIEIQAIRLSNEVQEAINKVWLSFLKPVQSEQEARARQIELEGVAKVLGTDSTALIEILKNMKVPANAFQQQPFMQSVFNTIDSKAQGLNYKPDAAKQITDNNKEMAETKS